MINILIIGLGSIGERHLESLLKSKKKLNIYVIDIKPIKNKFLNIKNHNIFYFNKIFKFKVIFILTIISTNSDVRYSLLLNFLKKNKTKNILLEKICFNKVYQYKNIKNLLYKNPVNVYVNYPRPMWNSYTRLKRLFKPKELKSLVFESSSWNLCSNSLHFINLFNFLTNTNSIKLKNENIYNRYFKSKRSSFFELKGKISFINAINQQITLVDTLANIEPNLSIDTKKYYIEIFERKNRIRILNKNNLNVLTEKFHVEFQSILTIKLLNKLLIKEKINISKFQDCINSDIIFLKSIYGISYKKFGKKDFIIT